jgi:hypothetical protein
MFGLSHVQPTAVFWPVVPCEPLNRDQFGFGGSVKDALSGRRWRMLEQQNGPPSAGCWRVRATVSTLVSRGRRDPRVAPSFASLGSVGLQQDAGLRELTGRMFPRVLYQRVVSVCRASSAPYW